MDFDDRLELEALWTAPTHQQVLCQALRSLRLKMADKYNCSQAYSELEIINKIVDPEAEDDSSNKKSLLDRILLNDLKFMEGEEYMEQAYEDNARAQLVELFEYYKYYLQDPAIYFHEHYDVMHRYYERRKGHVYNQLKKILTLSEVEDGKGELGNEETFLFQSEPENLSKKDKKRKEKELDPGLANILAEITLNRSSEHNAEVDESLHFDDLKARLIKFYGPPSSKSMQIIDSIYNFNKVGQDHLPFKNQQKFYHGGVSSTRKEFGEIVSNNFKKKNNLFHTNTSTRFMESTNISNSQRCPHTSINEQQPASAIRPREHGSRRQVRRKSGRRYKSTGNSQDTSDLKIQVSQESMPKFTKNVPGKKSKLRRKSSDLIFSRFEKGKTKPVFSQEILEESSKIGTRKKKHTGRVKSTQFNIESLNSCLASTTTQPYLQGTIAKFKKKIQQQKLQIVQQKKTHTLVPQKSSGLLKVGVNYRETHNNLSQHQNKKKPGTKNRVKPQKTIGVLHRNF